MKTFAIVLGSLALAVALVAGGLLAGTAWAQGRWDSDASGYGPMGRGMMGYGWDNESAGSPQDLPCRDSWQGYGMGGMRGGSLSGPSVPVKTCPVAMAGRDTAWAATG